jgi:homoserine kinase type II
MRSEAWLLLALEDKNLPFCLPVLLNANNGAVVIHCRSRQGSEAFATLSPLLPGAIHDLPSAAHAAVTLADGYPPFPFGERASWHQLIPDLLAALEHLLADRLQVIQLQAFLREVREAVPGLYATLPQPVLHRDYDPSNILLNQQRVTAVLDFEFAGRDMRVLGLRVALSWWPVNLLGTGKEWDLLEVLGSAYTRQLALSEPELLALPAVLRLRDAVSLVQRMGRYFARGETQARMQHRVEHSFWREAWLSVQQKTLLDYALAGR